MSGLPASLHVKEYEYVCVCVCVSVLFVYNLRDILVTFGKIEIYEFVLRLWCCMDVTQTVHINYHFSLFTPTLLYSFILMIMNWIYFILYP